MYHTSNNNGAIVQRDADSEEDYISAAPRVDGTVEFLIYDETNMREVKYSSMIPEEAVEFCDRVKSVAIRMIAARNK